MITRLANFRPLIREINIGCALSSLTRFLINVDPLVLTGVGLYFFLSLHTYVDIPILYHSPPIYPPRKNIAHMGDDDSPR